MSRPFQHTGGEPFQPATADTPQSMQCRSCVGVATPPKSVTMPFHGQRR